MRARRGAGRAAFAFELLRRVWRCVGMCLVPGVHGHPQPKSDHVGAQFGPKMGPSPVGLNRLCFYSDGLGL